MVDFPLRPALLDRDVLDNALVSRSGDAALGNAASGTSPGLGFVHESSKEMNPSPLADAEFPSPDSKLLYAFRCRFGPMSSVRR